MATPANGAPMDAAEFRRVLNIGLGRAILYLRQHSASPHRDAILFACLNVTAFDPQSEGSHSFYVSNVIRLTRNVEFYRSRIFDVLKHAVPSDDHRLALFFELTLHFAQEGNQEARKIIHRKAKELFRLGNTAALFAVCALDGVDGLVWALKHYGAVAGTFDGDPRYDFNSRISQFEDAQGKEVVRKALMTAAAKHKRVQRRLSDLEAYNAEWRGSSRGLPPANYETVEAAILNSSAMPYGSTAWMEDETDTIMEAFAAKLLAEQDPRRLLKRLQLFQGRPFPLDQQRLSNLAEYGDNRVPDDRLAFAAMRALRLVTHPDVRALALRMIAEGNNAGRALGMLHSNFQPDDWTFIKKLTKQPMSAEEFHHLGSSVRDLYKAHPSDEAVDSILNLYEYEACSFCREYTVKILHRMGKLPDTILEECKYDANLKLRKRARHEFASPYHDET